MDSNQVGSLARRFAATVGIGLMLLFVVPVMAQTDDGGYRVFRPDGPGPHPAVVFVSGCYGLKPHFAPKFYEQAAERLRAKGFIIVWADYMSRRNLDYCHGFVTQEEMAREAVAAAAWLRSKPDVDTRRITAMGWSMGGGAVIEALGSYSANELIFTRAIAYYPFCESSKPWTHSVPLLALLGDADNVAPPEMCKWILEMSAQKGVVKVITYPGAQHFFDHSEMPPRMDHPLGTMGYHPRSAAAAWEEVERFLEPAK